MVGQYADYIPGEEADEVSRMRNRIDYDKWNFSDSDIKRGSIKIRLAASLLSTSLEANTFSAVVKTSDDNIRHFTRNTPLTYYHRDSQRMIACVQSVERVGASRYRLEGTSAIGLLMDRPHTGGIYTGQTVGEVVADICGPIPFIIKDNLAGVQLYGWLPYVKPPKASARDNLRQVLFAIGAAIRTDLDGVLRIEALWDGTTGYIGRNKLYRGAEVKYGSEISQVIVTEHQYAEGQEEKDLFEGTTQSGDVITFSEPMHSLSASGFSIVESGANYAVLTSGSGRLTGKKYIHNTRQVSRIVSASRETASESVKSITDATLVSLVNSSAVAERLANYYACLETINGDIVLGRQSPGDVVNAYHPYDKAIVPACIQSLDITASGILRAKAKELVGFYPPKIEQTIIYDQKEILTGSGVWIPPKGAVNAHVVLIGGGGKGENGESGTGSSSPGYSEDRKTEYIQYGNMSVGDTETLNLSSSGSSPSAPAGKGGAGGAAGVPGYVYELDIDIADGESFSYSCGAAGDNPGETGGATLFGVHSSASGGILPNGYTDIISGIVYAASGTAGVSGGNGGSAGEKGEDVGVSTGGNGAAGTSTSDSDTFTSGSSNNSVSIRTTASASMTTSASGGGGAGGGTEDNPGENGGNGGRTINRVSIDLTSAAAFSNYSTPGKGGAGANGKNGETYGSAGSGGHGGGGAGANSSSSSKASLSTAVTKNDDTATGRRGFSCVVTSRPRYGASGGAGGTGGLGKEGCVIVYYGVPHVIQSGAVMTSDKKFLLDRTGRLIVV